MNYGKLVLPVFVGLLSGLLALAVFQFFAPFVETAISGQSDVRGSAEIEQYLKDSALLNLYYILSWSVVVFLSACLATRVAKEGHKVAGMCSGGIYFLVFLANFDLLQNQPLYYVIFLVLGAGALYIPCWILNRKLAVRVRTSEIAND